MVVVVKVKEIVLTVVTAIVSLIIYCCHPCASKMPKSLHRQHQVCVFLSCSSFSKSKLKQCKCVFLLPQRLTTHHYPHWPCVKEGASARPKAHRRQRQVCLFLSCLSLSKSNLKQCKCAFLWPQHPTTHHYQHYHHTCTQARTLTNTNTYRLCISAA